MMRPIPLFITVCISFVILFSTLMWLQDAPAVKIVDIETQSPKEETILPVIPMQKTKQNVLLNEDFKQSVKGIAQSFAQQSRFPATSMPIENEDALQKYIPNQSMGASLPFEGPNGEALRLSLRTDKYRYFDDDIIKVVVKLMGDSALIDAEIIVSVLANRKVLHQVASGPLNMGAFNTVLDTSKVNTSDWPKELHLQAVALVNGETMQVVETFRYEPQIASVKSVGKGSVESDYLVIPVAIDTKEKGYFRITGILFSESTGKPLVHLEGKSKITLISNTVNLKAQLRALQVNDDEGPYLLKNIWIEKMPGAPDYETAYGVADEDAYPIGKHSFYEYSDVDYEDPAAKRSLEFLNKIGGANTDK